MTYALNSSQARTHARAELNIFEECYQIMKAIIQASDAGHYEVTINSGTPMTSSTPAITITGSVSNPTVTLGDTIILDSTTITLGSSGTNLNAIISDINDANVTGVVASKNNNGQLVITYTSPPNSWNVTVGSGTANTSIGLTPGSVTASTPGSTVYYDTWAGLISNRKYDDEILRVRRYLENLGYTVVITKNTATGRTMEWNVYW